MLIAAGAVILAGVFAFRFTQKLNPQPTPTPSQAPAVIPPPIYKAEVYLWVQIPENTPLDEKIILEIIDEVTGLPYNSQHIEMVRADDTHYGIALHLRVGSILKYRYLRAGDTSIPESTPEGTPVRYRLFYADGPSETHDIISRWQDTPFTAQTGRIVGTALEADTGLPISDLLIFAGGKTTLTATDGSFMLYDLPVGRHHIVAYAKDGFYKTYKQNALVAPLSATPVTLPLQNNTFAEVTFTVTVPENTIPIVPLRLAGSLSQLGNSFSDLGGGISGLPEKMPQLTETSTNQYSITLALPTNTHIQYKYTQGDGYWNAEFRPNSSHVIRDLILPPDQTNLVISDLVSTWQPNSANPIWFDLNTPNHTPQQDQLYLQFNHNGWMAPVPMWQIDPHRWAYQLFDISIFSDQIEYRYCRNAQCGYITPVAVEASAPHTSPTTFSEPPTLVDTIEEYYQYPSDQNPATVLSDTIQPRSGTFLAGIALSNEYMPSWDIFNQQTITQVQKDYANTIILTPTWHITHQNPPTFQQVPGKTISIPALGDQIQLAHQQGLKAALFPQPYIPDYSTAWWDTADLDAEWWSIWYEQYRIMVLNFADIAQRYNADILILGGNTVYPNLPDITLPNGTPANPPPDINQKISNLIQEVRAHYSGTIAWQYPQTWAENNPPQFLQLVDQVHLHWGISLATWSEATLPEIHSRIEIVLDKQVLPFKNEINKPVIISAGYPSTSGGITNCLQIVENSEACLPFEMLSPLNPQIAALQLDTQEQVEVYNALLSAINQRPWVGGFISEGYFPPVALHDFSTSIHGKPAEAVLRFWFKHFLIN